MDSKEARRLSRRDALRLAAGGSAMVAAGSLFSATTHAAPLSMQRAAPAARQGEEVTLRVMDWQSGGKDFWDTTDALFMEQNPGIRVEHEAVPYGQYFDKVGAYVAADDGPDLMQLEVGLGTLKYKDVLIPLNEYVGDIFDEINGTSAFCDNFDCSTQIYGVPHTNQGHMVYFNKAVFQEVGLDAENPPRTWSEFDAAAQQIKDANKQVFAFGGKEWASLWTWCNLPHQTATVEEQRGLYTGDVKWTDDPWKNTWVLFEDMVQRGWFPEGAAATNVTPDAQDSFVRGDAAFFHSIISDAFNWKLWGDLMGYENFGVMKFPQIEADFPLEGVSPGPLAGTMDVHGGIAFSIPTWSNLTDEAIAYIKFVLSPETQTRFLVEGGAFPSSKNFDASVVDVPQFEQIVEWVNEPGVAVPGLLYCTPEEWDEIIRQSQLMLLGQANPDDAAEALQRVHDQVRR
jgi:ABC-type glycerol-3-phosphate transport system substrate-binding protein